MKVLAEHVALADEAWGSLGQLIKEVPVAPAAPVGAAWRENTA